MEISGKLCRLVKAIYIYYIRSPLVLSEDGLPKFSKSAYSSDLIVNNHHSIVLSDERCCKSSGKYYAKCFRCTLWKLLDFFLNDKIINLRPQVNYSYIDPLVPTHNQVSWEAFAPISPQPLKDIISHLKPSTCSLDILHPRLLKLFIDSVGQGFVSFLNKSLLTGSVLAGLKVATVTPLLMKPSRHTTVLKEIPSYWSFTLYL